MVARLPDPSRCVTENDKFLKLLAGLGLFISVVFLVRYSGMILGGEARFAPDFEVFYRAAQFFSQGGVLYLNDSYRAAMQEGLLDNYYPYLYPPFALFMLWPLALFDYETARCLFLALQVMLWLLVLKSAAVGRLWPLFSARKHYLLLVFCISLPFMLNTFLTGQLGIFYAAVFLYGLALVKERPVLAGAVLAFMAVKPTLALLLPFFLIAARQFRALSISFLCVAFFSALSVVVWGTVLWAEWFEALRLHALVFTQDRLPQEAASQMASIYSGLRLLGAGAAFSMLIQIFFMAAALTGVCIAAARGAGKPETLLLLFSSVFIASAYVWQYDAVLLSAAMFLLVEMGCGSPLKPLERIALIIAVFSGLVTLQLQRLGIPYGAAVVLLLWVVALCRAAENGVLPRFYKKNG